MAAVSATLTGNSTTLTVGLSGAAGTVTYQWQNSSSAGGTFSNIAGATSAAFNYSSYADSATSPYIRPVVTDGTNTYDDIAVIKVYKNISGTTKIDITFGSDIESIGYNAFIACSSLANVVIGDAVTTIGQQAFYACSSLANIDFGSVTSIGNSAFESCTSLAILTIGDSVTSIGQAAFYNCGSLATITVSPGNTTFFTDSRGILYQITDATNNYVTAVLCPPATTITNITIDTVQKNGTATPTYTVTSIGKAAFDTCTSLANVVIGDSVTSIGDYAFAYCSSLANVVIGDSVTSIGQYAFYDCRSLATLTIGDSVTSIGDSAFRNCDSLATVVIGDSVESIGIDAFKNCQSLANIYFLGAKPNSDNIKKNQSFLTNNNDTAYYRAGQTGWNNATTINGISKIRRIPTIDPIITATQITGSCDDNLSPVLVYVSSNDGRTWRKYKATKDNGSTTWSLETDSITTLSIKVSTIANYYDESKNTDEYIYCKSETNDYYLSTTDTSLSTFTIGGAAADEDDFEVSLPYGIGSVEVTARATVDEESDGNYTNKAAVFIQVNDGDPTKLGYDVDYTRNISSLNPGENTITITVKNPRDTGEEVDYTGYIHVLPDAPAIATTFTTGYTNDNTPTLSGTTDAALDTNGENTTVTLYTVTTGTITDADTTTYTYTFLGEAEVTAATGNGGNGKPQWTFTPTDAFADGTHTIVATAQYSRSVIEDDANNKFESEYSNTITFTVDTVAPNKPVIVSTSKPDLISGTAEADSTVLVKKDGDQVATVTVTSAGVWTLNVASIDSYAPAKYSYVGQDTALNVSDATTFDPSQFTIRYPTISIKAGQQVKRVIPHITGTSGRDESTVFTVASQSKLTKAKGSASIDRNTGRLTVKAPWSKTDKITEKITVTVKASSPIYGTKVATVKITIT